MGTSGKLYIYIESMYNTKLNISHGDFNLGFLFSIQDPINFTDTYIAMHYYRVLLSTRHHEEWQIEDGICNETNCNAVFLIPSQLLLDDTFQIDVIVNTVNIIGESEGIHPGFRIGIIIGKKI